MNPRPHLFGLIILMIMINSHHGSDQSTRSLLIILQVLADQKLIPILSVLGSKSTFLNLSSSLSERIKEDQ